MLGPLSWPAFFSRHLRSEVVGGSCVMVFCGASSLATWSLKLGARCLRPLAGCLAGMARARLEMVLLCLLLSGLGACYCRCPCFARCFVVLCCCASARANVVVLALLGVLRFSSLVSVVNRAKIFFCWSMKRNFVCYFVKKRWRCCPKCIHKYILLEELVSITLMMKTPICSMKLPRICVLVTNMQIVISRSWSCLAWVFWSLRHGDT
jgi:hypothetical protein